MGNEEANEIALLALRQVGCDLPEGCGGVESFSTDILVRTTSHCLHVTGNSEMSEYGKAALPPDMSTKFRICTELAEAVKKLGYREELGFHQFLYPAEKSSRELIAFLLDRLPQAVRGDQVTVCMLRIHRSAIPIQNPGAVAPVRLTCAHVWVRVCVCVCVYVVCGQGGGDMAGDKAVGRDSQQSARY